MSVGETALPGVPVMTLLRIGSVKVRFSVPEQEIAAMGADSRTSIRVPALDDTLLTAGRLEKGAVANPRPIPMMSAPHCRTTGERSFPAWFVG